MFWNCIMKLKWTNSNVTTSPIFDGLFHVIKSLIILIASFVRDYKSTLHIKSKKLSFIMLCFSFSFCFFKDMHYNTMIRTFCILKKMTFSAFHYLTLIMKLKWTNSNVTTSPIFDGLFHVIKSLIILIASFVRDYIMMLKLHEWSQEITKISTSFRQSMLISFWIGMISMCTLSMS
jgi:uncharacterized membrane protein